MEIKETSLINLHKSHGAKLVEFAGYNMPIQYSDGILNEHKFTYQIVEFLMFHIWVSYLLLETMI